VYHTHHEMTLVLVVSEGTGMTLCFWKMGNHIQYDDIYLPIAGQRVIRSDTKQTEKE
jgi:hypothetical protein